MLATSLAFLHNFFLLKAFEGAPSTVLLPLVQVASVSVLLLCLYLSTYVLAPARMWRYPLTLALTITSFDDEARDADRAAVHLEDAADLPLEVIAPGAGARLRGMTSGCGL